MLQVLPLKRVPTLQPQQQKWWYLLRGGSLTTFREAWNGVDLLGVNLEVERGTVLVDDATEAADFIESDEGVQWLRAPLEIRHEVADMIRALSPHTLRGSLTRVRLNVSGSYLELEMSTEYLENGYVGLKWDMTSAKFTVRWANPLWELSGWHAEAETSKIAS